MGEDEEAAACVESVPQEVISPIARARSAKSQDRAVAVREKQLVIFRVSDEFYGVDIAVVQEVIKLQRITAVPRAPDFIEGLINLRGTVLPVIDLRRRFGLPEQPPTKETRIVIAEIKEMSIGVLVDAVTEVLRVPESEIEPPSPLSVTMDSAFIFGIAKIPPRLIALLDLNKVLAVEERK
ncbi:MAG: purine-binding chemotaxis protein CheW [Anaerolineae bacterium]|nr:purine-binding chemotaxis protein CheW [Anaerolineae bacterium]